MQPLLLVAPAFLMQKWPLPGYSIPTTLYHVGSLCTPAFFNSLSFVFIDQVLKLWLVAVNSTHANFRSIRRQSFFLVDILT